LFRQFGFRLCEPRPLIASADPAQKEELKKTRLLAREDAIDLWALDEVRFPQHGSCCRMWVPPEIKESVLLHHPTHRGVGYFGAVELRNGKCIFHSGIRKFHCHDFLIFSQTLTVIQFALGGVWCHHR